MRSLLLIAIFCFAYGEAHAETSIQPGTEFAIKNPEVVDILEADEKQAIFLLKRGSNASVGKTVTTRFCRQMGGVITEEKQHDAQPVPIPKGMIEVEKSYQCGQKFMAIFARISSEAIYGPAVIVIGEIPLTEEHKE